jgi:adenylate cyclase
VLVADVAGYSRLLAAYEERTLDRLASIQLEVIDPTIATNHGRLVKTTGDGLWIEFVSVIDAVRCAIEMQRLMATYNGEVPALERIEYRIGINVGEIVIGKDGEIFGGGVNIAARLEALADPGGICVSARVQEDVAGRLEIAFEDMGEQGLKDIRWPVHTYRVLPKTSAHATRRPPAEAVPAVSGRGKPSIAVLPFENMSGDPDQAFFADGMVEDIITELSRDRSLFVVARTSSFSYRGRSMDIRQVAADLGVRYVLEGSVRRSAARVRVNAQLIDAGPGAHLWAERYDRELADIFAVQDEITRAVSMAIGPAVSDAEQVRATRVLPAALDAWEALHRGLWYLERVDPESNAVARKLFEQAIAIDPQFAQPHAWLVQTYLNEIYLFHTLDHATAVQLAERHGLRAVELDPDDATAHVALAWTAAATGDALAGLARADRALTINPNHADAHRCRTSNLIWLGRLEEAREVANLCLRLSPQDARGWISLHHLLLVNYLLRDYSSAVEIGSRLLNSRPAASLPYRWLAAALGQEGRIDEAQAVLRRAVAVVAPLSIKDYVSERGPWLTDVYYEHLHEGLRRAGWTEGEAP